MNNLAINKNIECDLLAIKEIIDQEIDKFINLLPDVQPLSSAVEYVLKTGGKRIRPLISLSILSDLQKDISRYAACGLAIELLHIASLVHDDLPALDNDNTRRGQNTCHIEFNEATAILTGDVLVAFAFNYLKYSNLSAAHNIEMIKILSEAFKDLCFGQQLDINPQKTATENSIVAFLKTGALFSAAFTIPFALIDAEQKYLLIAKEIGLNLGLLYQLCDDLADHADSAGLKGREVSSDMRNKKNTFYANSPEHNQLTIKSSFEKIMTLLEVLQNEYRANNNFNLLRESLNLLFKPFKLEELNFNYK